eukprot:TRINITY_DN73758_c0_g1_i1.p1 TRINITY_DN73758_c0_g1~~TRINITY_DN73758_c0_g1_i1.p1  ORF type:complete len:484 (+),score=75.25 TRINITY_DN73758_c0_g1_i1:83-1534(+)
MSNVRRPLLEGDEDRPVRRVSRVASTLNITHEYSTSFPPLLVCPGRGICVIIALLVGVIVSLLTLGEEWLASAGVSSEQLLEYVSIPVVSVLFTYAHIWGALYMTFYPMRFIGCLQIPETNVGCGWQGIVPSRAAKMARTAVDLMTKKVVGPEEMFERIDPKKLAEELDPVLQSTLMHIISEVAMEEDRALWTKIPQCVKDELILKAREDAPPAIEAMMNDIKRDISRVFDLEEMIINAFTRDPALLNHMFISCGYQELVFIRNCGAWMGGLFGICQVVLWIFWSAGWMLPTFGFVVGILSNWLALKIIFSPVKPVSLFGGRIVLQGLFLKRQAAVSAEYAKIVADNVLSSRNLIPAVMRGRCADVLFELLHKHVRIECDNYAGVSKRIVQLFAGSAKIERCKKKIGDHLIESLPSTMRHAERYVDEAMDLENLLADKMGALPPDDFESLLHPVFEEDEWKLIVMGGVLGVVIGCMQWAFLGK